MDKLAAILPNKLLGVMLIWLLFAVTGAVAASNDLIESAHELQLAENPAWLDLIHLNTHVASSGSSEIDDPRFYLATDGRNDAQAELDATLRRFSEDASMACQFPARWHWLSQYLDLGPPPACADLNIWKIKLAAHHLTLLFPAMYLQNPASMFGHTFLRFDQVDTSPLLVYTLSYAAKPDTQDNVLSYVYKGVFGGYPGVFAVQPYYQTVTEYGDIEQRDIWEYSLNLNASEIDQLLNHVWELRDKKINYYFFRENCAYQLLALLDVARPGLHLARQHFPFYAIPVDTVRSLSEMKLIESVVYRPARATRVAQMHAQLDVTLQTQAVAYADGHVAVDAMLQNNHDASRVLELATEIRQLKNINAEDLLSQRSQISQPANWLPFVNDDPITSHDSARGSVAYGNYEQRGYIELGLRSALHDWLDNDTGLIEGAGLEILTTRLRYYPDENRVQLQQLTVFSMHSFSPIRPWVTPLSSELIFAMNRVGDNKVYLAEGGIGFSAQIAGLHAYVLADIAIETMPERDQSEAIYLGAHLGVRRKIVFGQWLLEAKWQNSYAGYDETRTLFKAGYQMNLSRDYALRMQYVLWRTEDMQSGDVQLALMKYF